MVTIKNKKGVAGITFLVIALLIVGLGLVVTTNKLYNYYNTHAVSETDDSTFYNIGNSVSSNDNSLQEDNSYTSISSGGSSGKHSSSSNSEPLPAESKKEKLLKKVDEEDYDDFDELEIDDKTIFYQQREIEGATVEKDFKVYQFDTDEELVDTNINWRDDLGEYATPQITQAEAEEIVGGEVQFSKLYIISPDSDIFPIEPTPVNPCWAVTSINEGNVIVTVIDSVTGEEVGKGVPPPYNAFTLSGPQYFNPCSGEWDSLTYNAEYWFNEMHYNTENVVWPTENKVQSHIQSNETVLFYEIAHGDSFLFKSGCVGGVSSEQTNANEIENWIEDYNKKGFTFLGSCDGMCDTGEGTLSYAFRKGSNENTVTVGYCGMAGSDCFQYSLSWQNIFFYYLKSRNTIKEAFDKANQDYPSCENVMRLEGDEDLKLVTCDDNYGEGYCEDGDVHKNKTCTNLAGVSFMKPYSERIDEECGESYYGDWGEDYCKEGNVYHSRIYHDAGCSAGACYDNGESEQEEIVEECEYGCGNAECLYPDLEIENLSIQNISNKKVILAFTIRNDGNYIANDIYYKVDTNSSDENLEIKIGTNLAPGEWTRAYTDPIIYSESGNYNPKVIVDFENLINESNESNNEASIEVSV